jgi:hypothetical protein
MGDGSEPLTKAEKFFEEACAAKRIRYRRFPVAKVPGQRRPDYWVNMGDCRAIVEVKQIEPNDEDRRQARELNAGRPVVYSSIPASGLEKRSVMPADSYSEHHGTESRPW